jgi:hypothetical protein
MRAIRVLWIDGQTKDGSGDTPAKLALHKDIGGRYRWFGQDYNEAGIPDGPCTISTLVSAFTVSAAMDAAWAAWGRSPWNLRTTRRV